MSGEGFVDFLNRGSGSPYTATAVVREMLLEDKYTELKEDQPWKLEAGGKYFFVRNSASVFAFGIGKKVDLAREAPKFAIVGAHTDSPALRLKPPCSAQTSRDLALVSCEVYGGGIWQTWFDRDLGIAGKVIVKDPTTGAFTTKTVLIRRPLLRIPTVAPHLDSPYADGFKVNKEIELRAILCELGAERAARKNDSDTSAAANSPYETMMTPDKTSLRHHRVLLDIVAKELGVSVGSIVGLDLRLCDAQAPTLGGAKGEFVFGQGIDNLNGSYCTTAGFLAANKGDALESAADIRFLTLFDHEECGSLSPQGANSAVVLQTMERILIGLADKGASEILLREKLCISVRKSLVVSVDNSHAIHPNYAAKHEGSQPPVLNGGPTIKHNANQRYASDAEGSLVLQTIAAAHGIPLQEFVIRQDTNCGTTIGPTTSGKTCVRTIDIGNPQLSMHSIREICGTKDVKYMADLICAFFTDFFKITIN